MLDLVMRQSKIRSLLAGRSVVMSVGASDKSPLDIGRDWLTVRGISDKSGVRAVSTLNQGSSTDVIEVSDLVQRSSYNNQSVDIDERDGRLYCVDRCINTSSWLKAVSIARDCLSCNVLLTVSTGGVVLKTIRNIAPGEPLLMWFEGNILAMLNMPGLTYANRTTTIKDECRYACHKCNCLFDFPNPLKVHLALDCNRLDMGHLWAQLAREFDSVLGSTPLTDARQEFPLFSPFCLRFLDNAAHLRHVGVSPITINANVVMARMNGSTSSVGIVSGDRSPGSDSHYSWSGRALDPFHPPLSPSPSLFSPTLRLLTKNAPSDERGERQQRHSAFTPYIIGPDPGSTATLPFASREHQAPLKTCLLGATQVAHPSVTVDAQSAARTENIASNLGRLRQGHQCIYCGKIYSRKYGLKIHIRTHTGYKPLKCKYCLRPFGDPSNLNKHVRLHADGETPYKCDLCGKVLVRRRDLERHIKSRHQNSSTDQVSEHSSDETNI